MAGNFSNCKIREASQKDKKRVVALLSEAFATNLSVNFVIKNDKKRKLRIGRLMEYSFEMGMHFGKIYVSKDLNVAGIVIFPEQKKLTVRSFLLNLYLLYATIGFKKVGKVINREKLIKQSHPDNPFVHLWYIGVDPGFQQKGYGSRMMQFILSEFSRPIYLETSTSSNIPFYKKHGFHIQKKISLGYELFCMNNECTSY